MSSTTTPDSIIDNVTSTAPSTVVRRGNLTAGGSIHHTVVAPARGNVSVTVGDVNAGGDVVLGVFATRECN